MTIQGFLYISYDKYTQTCFKMWEIATLVNLFIFKSGNGHVHQIRVLTPDKNLFKTISWFDSFQIQVHNPMTFWWNTF